MTIHGRLQGDRGAVYEALRTLDTTIAEMIAIYTGLNPRIVSGILRTERYDWCDIVDHVSNGNEVAIWQYQGLDFGGLNDG